MPDLYFYRDPLEAEAEAKAAEDEAAAASAQAVDVAIPTEVQDWDIAQDGQAQNWAEEEAEWTQPQQV